MPCGTLGPLQGADWIEKELARLTKMSEKAMSGALRCCWSTWLAWHAPCCVAGLAHLVAHFSPCASAPAATKLDEVNRKISVLASFVEAGAAATATPTPPPAPKKAAETKAQEVRWWCDGAVQRSESERGLWKSMAGTCSAPQESNAAPCAHRAPVPLSP